MKVKPRVLIIDETLTGPVDARKYLGHWFNQIDTNGITEFRSIDRVTKKGLHFYDLIVATPSFIRSRAENVWPEILPLLLNTPHCPRVIMVTDSAGFKASLPEDERLLFANSPERVIEFIGHMLF